MIDFRYQDNTRVPDSTFSEKGELLTSYIGELKENLEIWKNRSSVAFMDLPFNDEAKASIRAVADQLRTEKLRYVVVIGIGGSSLGTKAVYDAALSYQTLHDDEGNETPGYPELLFLSTLSHNDVNQVLAKLSRCQSPEEFAVVVVSKSGNTTETISNASVVYNILSKQYDDVSERFACVTNEGSKLWLLAKQNHLPKLAIPDQVGGRYSVFSAVGLLPLMLAGMDVDSLLMGAKNMREKCLSTDFFENPAAVSAVSTFYHYENGKDVHNLFLFDPTLESVGKWWRQLIGESLGKEKDIEGYEVNTGILPVFSIGPNDLHSVGQLHLGGPKNIFTTFVSIQKQDEDTTIPQNALFTQLLLSIQGRTYGNLMKAILEGVKTAYKEREMPFAEVSFSELSAEEIGAFMQMKMMETVYVARLMNVNPFDQPNVEEYKSETRRLLDL